MSETLFNHPQLYDAICKIPHTSDCRVYYHKAAYEFLYRKQIKKSYENICKAISLFESSNYGITVDVANLNVDILNKLCEIELRANPNYHYRMYQLAAELCAELGKEDECLRMYKRFYYLMYSNNIVKEICEKDTVDVYSFRSYNVYSIQDLINEEITCVHPGKMNDPFDSIACHISKEENLKRLCKRNKHVKIQSELYKHFSIRSFIANRQTYGIDERIVTNIPMWSFYADNHKGFCIRYRLGKDFFCQHNDLSNSFTQLFPVEYTDDKIKIDNKLDTHNSFALKNKCWETENEVRLLHYEGGSSEDHYSIPLGEDTKIEEIIFGYLCPNDTKRTIANILKGKCNLYELYVDDLDDIYTLKKKEYKLTEQ